MLIPMASLVERHGVRPTGILHLGANTGEEAQAYADAGAHRVVWFEANPGVMIDLERHLRQFPGQVAVHAAVADEDGREVEFHIASNGQSSSLLKMKLHRERYPRIYERETITLTARTVDSLLERHGFEPASFNFANLDLQGGELRALVGMQRCLPHLAWIYCELNFEELYEGCPLAGALDQFLGARGFARRLTADTDRGWGDALYVRES